MWLCGCRLDQRTRETGQIRAGNRKSGDADSPGVFYKTIIVHYNGKDSPAKLKISGQVTYPQDLKIF